MIRIGEKINGAIPAVAHAIQNRDAKYIRTLAEKQVEAGVDYLDVCAGTKPEQELEVLTWLVDIVQSTTDVPICLDSPDAALLKQVMPQIKKPGIINSVSGEGCKADLLFPLLKENDWQAVVLTCDDNGIPADAKSKVEIGVRLIEKAMQWDLKPERLHIDPLVLSVSAVNHAMLDFLEAVRELKRRYPTVKITAALSNISYGMPCRKLINQNFLALALYAGLDSAILDPTEREMVEVMLATEVLLNRDRFGRNYLNAFRKGQIGAKRDN